MQMDKNLSELSVKFSTLVELLRSRALFEPEQKAYTFLLDGEVEGQHLTYGDLDFRARAIGAWLQNYVASGERALLLYPPGLEYITAFFGCLYAGVVAVPAYPPRPNHSVLRLQAIAKDTQAKIALTTTKVLDKLERKLTQSRDLQHLRCFASDNIKSDNASIWQEPDVNSETLAFLQYTSGSTSRPKGVMVSHRNLLHNQQLIQQAMQHTEKTIFVGWLPLFHDMGLIGNMLQPLYLGIPCILMSPVAFLQSPVRWLQAISRYKATTSGGPNFAYDLCVSKITPTQRATLDLSSWEVAFNGAEPVRAETLERFSATFSQCGFRASAFYPCYGMAETTLIVSGGRVRVPPVIQTVEKQALEQNRVVQADGANDADWTRTVVGCGQTLLDQQIVIVHPENLSKCLPNQVGEIWVSGSSVAQGYWRRPEETEYTFGAYVANTGEGLFLRTGDLGFLVNGELFVTGRLKDLIIIRGRNHYPQDIELTVEKSHPVLRPNSGAAFTVEIEGEERLAIAQEVERRYLRTLDVDEVAFAIRQTVVENHDLQVYAVLLLKTGRIPKTSSGKIQRHACRSGFLNGSLDVVGSSILNNWDLVASEGNLSREALLAIAPEERQLLLESHLHKQVAQTLRVAPSSLDPQQPLNTLGLDSVMAVELKHSVETELGVAVPLLEVLQSSSVTHLAAQILAQLEKPTPKPLVPLARQENAQQILANIEQLSEQQVDALLSTLLSQEKNQ